MSTSLVTFPFAHVPPTLDDDTVTALNAECSQWAEEHGIFSNDHARRRLAISEPSRLAALVWPKASLEQLRPISYFCAWYILWDDVHDVYADGAVDTHGAATTIANVLDFLDGSTPTDAWTAALADCVYLIYGNMAPCRRPRIATGLREVLLGVALQHIAAPTTVDMVNTVRRLSVSVPILISFLEPALGIDVPSYEYDDPDVRLLAWHTSHNGALVNDAVSTAMEQHEANPWNSALAYAATHNVDVREGIAESARSANEHARAFEDIASKRLAPDRAPTNDLVQFVDGMRGVMTGQLAWAQTVARYQQ